MGKLRRDNRFGVPSMLEDGRRNPEWIRLHQESYRPRKAELVRKYRAEGRIKPSGRQGRDEYREGILSFLRERQDRLCGICGKFVEGKDESVDHIVAVKRGGTHHYSNLRLAHLSCNMRRGTK